LKRLFMILSEIIHILFISIFLPDMSLITGLSILEGRPGLMLKTVGHFLHISDYQKAEIRRSRSFEIIPNFCPSVSFVSIPLYM
jgi:hypothetical protein